MIIEATNITKRFYGFTALNAVDFQLGPGERVGLIGPNGSGKSTLINCLAGTSTIDDGSIRYDGVDITGVKAWRRPRMGLVRTFQIPRPFRSMTVRQNVEMPLMFILGHHDQAQVETEAEAILAQVGLAALSEASPRILSQVELRKLELGRSLAAKPRVLFTDEPMAGLSRAEADEITDLLLRLNADGVAIVLIEHIMRTVMRFSQRLVVLLAGNKIADGLPQDVIAQPEVERSYLGQ
jgi:branched-chain amino acid transport system ATP-binding protein